MTLQAMAFKAEGCNTTLEIYSKHTDGEKKTPFTHPLLCPITWKIRNCSPLPIYEKKLRLRLGAVAHAYNTALSLAKMGRLLEARSLRPTWPTWQNPAVSTKNTKISRAWWWIPVVPAIVEAEAGESLEPRRWRLQWAKIAPLHTSLGNKSKTPSQKKKIQSSFLEL